MKHTRVALVSFALPLLISPAALIGCGSRVTTAAVTETGNPPFIEEDGIATQALSGRITVTGRAGTATPNAQVKVTDLSSGDSATQPADADGAFKISVTGEAGDDLKLSVTVGDETTELVVSVRAPEASTDAAVTPTAPSGTASATPPKTCQEIAVAAFDLIPELEASGTCERDADCIAVPKTTACVSTCDYYVTSVGAANSAAADVAQKNTGVCAALSAANCEVPFSGFICPPIVIEPPIPVCVDNLCVAQ